MWRSYVFRFVVGTRFEVLCWYPRECKEVLETQNEKISKRVEKAAQRIKLEIHGNTIVGTIYPQPVRHAKKHRDAHVCKCCIYSR